MIEQIDWSKAPEGYPLWLEDLNKHVIDQSGWHVDNGDRYSDVTGRFWLKSSAASYRVHTRPTTKSWSGEGLPPVGVECEVGGEKFVIVAHHCDGIHAIYAESVHEGVLYYGAKNEFRPIRTPEQIAAELADQAIKEMAGIICRDGAFDIDDPEVTESAVALYDAGYRKQ